VKVEVLVECNPMMGILVVRVVVVLVLRQVVPLEVLEIGLPMILQPLHQIKDMLVVVDMDFLQITLELVVVAVVLVVLEQMGRQVDQQ
jgi:hypothetical protein